MIDFCNRATIECQHKIISNNVERDVSNGIDSLKEDIVDLVIILLKDNDVTDRDAGLRLVNKIFVEHQNRITENINCSFCDNCSLNTGL